MKLQPVRAEICNVTHGREFPINNSTVVIAFSKFEFKVVAYFCQKSLCHLCENHSYSSLQLYKKMQLHTEIAYMCEIFLCICNI